MGCTRLGSGERTQLTGVYRAFHEPAPFRRQITVLVGPRPGRPAVLNVVGTVHRTLVVAPEQVVLSPDYLEAKTSEAKYTLTNQSPLEVALQEIADLPEGLTAVLSTNTLRPGEACSVVLTAQPLFLSTQRYPLTLLTSHPQEGKVPIPVQVRPVHELRAVPGAFRFGVVSRKELLRQGQLRLQISGRRLADLKVGAITLPQYLRAQDRRLCDGSRLELTFRLVDAFPSFNLDDEIVVEFHHDRFRQPLNLRVPVSGIVRDATPAH